MHKKLDTVYTWEELAERVIRKTNIKQADQPRFRKWWQERKHLGWMFDDIMIKRCFNIWKDLENELDHFVVLSGREGIGKSTFSFQLASMINPNFTLKNIAYGVREYLKILERKSKAMKENQDQPKESIVLDEGTELLSRESNNLSNRILTKTFFIQRALRFVVLVNCPNFFLLDTVIRNHRVKTLIDIHNKGKYKCITGKGIPIAAEKGMRTKQVGTVPIPDGYQWNGTFRKDFPCTIDKDEYLKLKLDSIDKLLEELQSDAIKQKFVATAKVAETLGVSQKAVTNMVKRDEIAGKKIGNKWYVTITDFEKMMHVEKKNENVQ